MAEAKKTHVRVIVPVLGEALIDKVSAEYARFAGGAFEVSAVPVRRGTTSIECESDSILAGPEVMRLVREAEAEGVDACTIACFTDPALEGARELVSIPVIGEGEAGLHMAAMMAERFSVLITQPDIFPQVRRVARRHGLADRLASVRGPGVCVMDLDESQMPAIIDNAVACVEQDGAAALVLGCTGVGDDMAVTIAAAVKERLGVSIPVIDPGQVALHMAHLAVSCGISHSKLTYPSPAIARPEYDFAE